ncbi:MAG: helix-turn-helix domain-containing protein [Hyphomicrobiaceae bacterium]
MTDRRIRPNTRHSAMTSERFRELRTALGWSMEYTAHMLGVSYSTVSRWEAGRQSIPRSAATVISAFAAGTPPRGAVMGGL